MKIQQKNAIKLAIPLNQAHQNIPYGGWPDILDKLNRRPHTDNLLEKAVINPASFVIPIELISPGTWTINKGLCATFVILKDCDLIQ